MSDSFDIVVIGAGMAGISVAARLADHARILVLEREDAPGTQSTGRSAALYAPGYGADAVRELTLASRDAFFNSAMVSTAPLVRHRASLFVATPGQLKSLEEISDVAKGAYSRLDGAAILRLVPMFLPGKIAAALLDESSADIDVDAMLQMYLKQLRMGGGAVSCNEPILGLESTEGAWTVKTSKRRLSARIVVNAAGAWADEIGELAELTRIGLQPKRRTAALVDAPNFPDFENWPTVIDADERYYFKPDAGRLLVSPAEETNVEPHDANADDLSLAEGIERISQLTSLNVKRAPRSWAGLRTFAPDRIPVSGFDPSAKAPFYWLAGQGGYGIQTAPALSEWAASDILGSAPPHWANDRLRKTLNVTRFR